ncbi:hypothetical protein BDV98DRAFT_606182 [Pterulicium gracile]|uniref:Hydrophobin n=1 Tax=Pterulicium gracile TaxID=1884261 RepID=A0A5C3QB74_9AGAR|nr:hypothetical protein BDV98DRAFT_606182 [Pterula gracilis]
MFSKLSTIILLAAASTALAKALEHRQTTSNTSCSSGSVSCCNSVAQPNSTNYAGIVQALSAVGFLKGFAIPIQGNAVPIGLQCNPISGAGAGSGSVCQSQAVCCDHTDNSGSIGVNCVPITINL